VKTGWQILPETCKAILTVVTKPPFYARPVAFDEIKLTMELWVKDDLVSYSIYLLLESAFLFLEILLS